MSIQPKVALAQEFLKTLAKLPPNVHAKVLKWTVQFQTNPASSGINYEKILNAVDPNLRSVRIDQDYRGILLKPEKDDLYILLYVDKHDEAYRWAMHRSLKVNPVTGALQILVSTEQRDAPAVSQASAAPREAEPTSAALLLSHVSKDDLSYFGVPEELVDQVWNLTSISDLSEVATSVGVATFEALTLLVDGFSVEDVKQDYERPSGRKIDVADFAASIDTDDSRAMFYVVEDEKELVAILNAPLSQWRIFLHPKQRKLAVSDFNGPVRVLGGAGTGKTVLAMHRARWLAENRTPDGEKVLFTTFTRNLAADIQGNLQMLCSKATLAKIEVVNLDRWVYGYLQKNLYPHKICYSLDEPDVKRAWTRALAISEASVDLDSQFYRSEWEQVIAAQGVTTLDEYRTARRVGRGVLKRTSRDAAWPVFEEFRSQLSMRKLKMVDDAYRDAAALLAGTNTYQPFSSIIVDETQDFGPMALRLLRAMIKPGQNDLFFVGDGHQRIYKRNRAGMGKCGINIVGRSKKLNVNYRTTDEIRQFATHLLEGVPVDNLDDGEDTNRGYISLSHGPAPLVHRAGNADEAVRLTVTAAKSPTNDDGSTQCVIAPSKQLCENVRAALQRDNIETLLLTSEGKDKSDSLAIRVATMRRAKGLEFDKVIVIAPKSILDPDSVDETDRKLAYVALTRAKREADLIVY
jgi:mRNA-degrading endonuclease RelE of RelBE toxin-antitoxin system